MEWFFMQKLLAVQQFLYTFLDPGTQAQLLLEGLELHLLFHGPQTQNYFFTPSAPKISFSQPPVTKQKK